MNETRYDAFISYRHLPLDKAIAERLQKLLEGFKPPKGVNYANTSKITRVFRDESELPTSSDLGGDIRAALEQSRYLIVLCSPALKESKWCMQEIEYFKQLHGGRTNNILPVLIDGDPAEVFPEQLRYDMRLFAMSDGSQQMMPVEVEPLASNVSGPGGVAGALGRLKTEFMRIAAPILGCAFDDLYGRHQRRARRRVMTAATAVLTVAAVFVGAMLYQNAQIEKQRDIALANEQLAQENEQTALKNQSLALASRSQEILKTGDRPLALLLAKEALPKDLDNPERPLTKEAQWAMFEALYTSMKLKPVLTDSIYTCYSPAEELAFAVRLNDNNTYTAGMWDYVGNLVVEFTGNEDAIFDRTLHAAFSPDGTILVTMRRVIVDRALSEDLLFQAWETDSGRLISQNTFGHFSNSNNAAGAYAQFCGLQFVTGNNFLIFGETYIGGYKTETGEVFPLDTNYNIYTNAPVSANLPRFSYVYGATTKVVDVETFEVELQINISDEEYYNTEWHFYSGVVVSEISLDGKYVYIMRYGEGNFDALYPWVEWDVKYAFDAYTGARIPSLDIYDHDETSLDNNDEINNLIDFGGYAEKTTAERSVYRGEPYEVLTEADDVDITVSVSNYTLAVHDNKGVQIGISELPGEKASGWYSAEYSLELFYQNQQYMYFGYNATAEEAYIAVLEKGTNVIISAFIIPIWDRLIFSPQVDAIASDDGKYLLYHNYDRGSSAEIHDEYALVINVLTGEILTRFSNAYVTPNSNPMRFGFTPDGHVWTTPGNGGDYISFFDVEKKKAVSLIDPPLEVLYNLTFSNDGKYIVGYGAMSGYLWDAKTGEFVNRLDIEDKSDENERLRDGVFLENEGVLITTTTSNSLIVWDYLSGLKLASLSGHTQAPTIDLNSGMLLVYTYGTMRLFQYQPVQMLDATKAILNGRKLTDLERSQNYCEIAPAASSEPATTPAETKPSPSPSPKPSASPSPTPTPDAPPTPSVSEAESAPPTPAVQAADWKAIYRAKIDEETSGDYSHYIALYLKDLNFDGVPELFMEMMGAEISNFAQGYTIVDGKAERFASFGVPYEGFAAPYENNQTGEISYILKDFSGGEGMASGAVYKYGISSDLSNLALPNPVLTEYTYEDRITGELVEERYSYLGNDVTASEYERSFNSFFAQYKLVNYQSAVLALDAEIKPPLAQINSFLDSYTPEPRSAPPMASKFIINGGEVRIEAYSLSGSSFVKLRDLAFALSGTKARFLIEFDSEASTIDLITRKAYVPVGTEFAATDGKWKAITQLSSRIYKDGDSTELEAYSINGNTCVKLKDIAALLGFTATYDAQSGSIVIEVP